MLYLRNGERDEVARENNDEVRWPKELMWQTI